MLPQEAKDNGHRHHAQVMGREFLRAGGYPPKPLQTAETAFDDVPPPVRLLVTVAPTAFLVLAVGKDRLDATFLQPLPQPARRVRLVPRHLGGLLRPSRCLLQEWDRLLRLMLLSRADGHRDGRTLAATDQVQLGAEAPLAATQGVVLWLTRR